MFSHPSEVSVRCSLQRMTICGRTATEHASGKAKCVPVNDVQIFRCETNYYKIRASCIRLAARNGEGCAGRAGIGRNDVARGPRRFAPCSILFMAG